MSSTLNLGKVFLETLEIVGELGERGGDVAEAVLPQVASCLDVIQSEVVHLPFDKIHGNRLGNTPVPVHSRRHRPHPRAQK